MSEAIKLNPKQELFLEYLFNDASCSNDTLAAAKKAGYASVEHAPLVRSLKDEIISRTQEYIAFKAPKAAVTLVNGLDEDGTTPKGDLRLKAAEAVLDRIGISKRQEMDINVAATSPLFFIPGKREVETDGEERDI